MKIVILLSALACAIQASHFRGAYMTWDPVSGRDFKFSFRSGWRLTAGPCGTPCAADPTNWLNKRTAGTAPPWTCVQGCPSQQQLHKHDYIVSAINKDDNYEQGEDSFTHTFSNDGVHKIAMESCCWITLGVGGNNIKVQATIPVGARSDTGKPDHSPRTAASPVVTVPLNTKITRVLPVSDSDGDNVRCRWATPEEAGGVSRALPNAVLDPNTCTLTFETTAANGYNDKEWYAVAIQIEDFPKSTITINGVTYPPTKAMSSVPLQFLIQAKANVYPPTERPILVTGGNKSHTVVLGNTFKDRICATSRGKTSISSWEITGPLGMTKGPLVAEPTLGPDVKCAEVTWKPNAGQLGTNHYCYHFKDNVDRRSDEVCSTVKVVDRPNPCASNPCQNGGACIVRGTGYFCECPTRTTGVNCETRILPCNSITCANGGRCENVGTTSYRCVCPGGFTGRLCETRIDPCAGVVCQNGGRCETTGPTTYRCVCAPGYQGNFCQTKINPCATIVCQNGGSCTVADPTSAYCACQTGYTGQNCETKVDLCSGVVCQNGGVCTVVGGVDTYCKCPSGFTGRFCEKGLNPCDVKPCQNGGTCEHLGAQAYRCICPPGYNGIHCQTAGLRPLPGNYPNPCTQAKVAAGKYHFTYAPDLKFFIQCDNWGNAFLRPCPPNEIWDVPEETCVDVRAYQAPCTRASIAAGVLIHVHPTDNTKYIQCTAGGLPVIQACPAGLKFYPAKRLCDY